jgi:hypothetical protein
MVSRAASLGAAGEGHGVSTPVLAEGAIPAAPIITGTVGIDGVAEP